ncbi:hypothetical protein [Prevotella sp. HUN102]|uniref:hypothetical protein n=1 Tax=Prevotella sp. HUN102 TaxID=1392486 RepID=UPI00048CA7DA|nr:hypothetical protein [Prevotella sp. HUN102]
MATTARNQITIVDLNDAKSVQVYFTASQGFSQHYNPDTHKFSPAYPSANNVITPRVYETGDPNDHLARCTNVRYTINGTAFTASNSNTSYVVGADGRLTVKVNLTGNLNVTFEADYADEDNIVSKIGGSFTVVRNESSGALFQVVLTCPKGNIFDKSVAGDLTVKAQAVRGGTPDTTNVSYAWTQFDIRTGVWKPVASGRSNGAVLTVKPDDVLNFQTFKCVATDAGGSDAAATAEEIVTFQDLTDPYVLELYCPTGDKIVNGTGSTTVNARVWQGGTKVEDEATPEPSRKFTYAWTKLDASGKPSNFNGTTSPSKAGNPLTVGAADISGKATFVCEITKK